MATSAVKNGLVRSKSRSPAPSESRAKAMSIPNDKAQTPAVLPQPRNGTSMATKPPGLEALVASKTTPQAAQSIADAGQPVQVGTANGHTVSEAVAVHPPEQSGNTGLEDVSGSKTLAEAQTAAAPISTALHSGLTREAAIERIDGFLRRMALEHDKENFFQGKVSTAIKGCENYYEKIKRPMYFALIREKLQNQEYRTLHQLQLDVELICSNATLFNNKASKVYKNAQSLLKASRKQFLVERVFLQEAVFALHPDGLEAARKDEEEDQKLMPPPKKLPTKPSKPSKPPKKAVNPNAQGLSRQNTVLNSFASGVPFALPTLGYVEDLVADLHTDGYECYSSFSDTDEDETSPAAAGGQPASQPWKPDGTEPASTSQAQGSSAAAQGRPHAWKLKRKGLEWRIRWLEHRLRDLNHQHTGYAEKLEGLRARASKQEADGAAQVADVEGAGLAAENAAPKLKLKRRRLVAKELGGSDSFIDHPFFAASAGLRRNKQIVRQAEEGDLSDEDDSYPARVFASAELLERHMYGLRQQLCQPNVETFAKKTGLVASKPHARGPGGHLRQSSSLPRTAKRARRTTDTEGSGVLLTQTSTRSVQPEKKIPIVVPKFHEISDDELQERQAILQAYEQRAKLKQEAQKEKDDAKEDEGMSTSSEDTSDEAYTRLHDIEEKKERESYVVLNNKKKNKLKATKSDAKHEGVEEVSLGVAQTPDPSLIVKTSGTRAAAAQAPNITLTVNVRPTNPSQPTEESPGTPVCTPGSAQGRAAATRGHFSSAAARGRAKPIRGRGRPPNAGRGPASAPAKQTRPAGPGRGHKNVKPQTPGVTVPMSAPPQMAAQGARAAPPSIPIMLGTPLNPAKSQSVAVEVPVTSAVQVPVSVSAGQNVAVQLPASTTPSTVVIGVNPDEKVKKAAKPNQST